MNITKSADNFQPMLKESIDRFLCEYSKGSSDFSNITSIFSRLLQNLPDPSLEYVWFYSALNFYSSDFTSLHSLKQVLAVKDLFQLLVSCSSSCNVVKKVALLAPVIYELCHLVIDKTEVYEEVEGLLEGIVSYISIFCGSEVEQDDRILDPNLNCCFVDLVRVWVVSKVGENCDFRENLRLFLPIVSDKVRDNVCVGCKVGQLAGVVMCEAFWLRLCLKFGLGSLREELAKDLRDCAVQMIAGFRSHYFLDGILRMLLEPALPVSSLLGCGDEVCLRQIVYDAVLTVEYSFLIPRKEVQLPCKSLKNFAVRWLLILDNALQSARYGNVKIVAAVKRLYLRTSHLKDL